VQVFGQGLTGSLDIFLHPHYTVSVSPMDFGDDIALLSIIVSLITAAGAFYLFTYYFFRRKGVDLLKEPLEPTSKDPP
jgi:hypothetical protein